MNKLNMNVMILMKNVKVISYKRKRNRFIYCKQQSYAFEIEKLFTSFGYGI